MPTPLGIFLRAAYRYGVPVALLSCMDHYVEEHRRGAFAIGAPNDHIERVTGRPAESFETVARRLAALPANQRGASRALREFTRSMTIPFVRLPNMRRYLRGLQITEPRATRYVGDSKEIHRD